MMWAYQFNHTIALPAHNSPNPSQTFWSLKSVGDSSSLLSSSPALRNAARRGEKSKWQLALTIDSSGWNTGSWPCRSLCPSISWPWRGRRMSGATPCPWCRQTLCPRTWSRRTCPGTAWSAGSPGSCHLEIILKLLMYIHTIKFIPNIRSIPFAWLCILEAVLTVSPMRQ